MSIINLNNKNFEAEALQSDQPVLIDFWAEWCGPCRMLSPLVDEIADELEGQVKIGKVNVDEEPDLAREYGVMSIPTLVVLKEGKVAASSVGVRPKEDIIKLLQI